MKKGYRMALLLLLLAAFGLTGCGSPELEMMESGLVKSGAEPAKAKCLAEKLGDEVKADQYNYVAKLLNEGMEEREAFTRGRRKYGAEFLSAVRDARKACGQ